MARSQQFRILSASPEWADWPTLARACEKARLSVHEAEAVLLYHLGYNARGIADDLGVRPRAIARLHWKAAHKMGANAFESSLRREFAPVLQAHRNKPDLTEEDPEFSYRPAPNTPDPEGLYHIRQPGTRPDDFIGPRRLLTALIESLV